MVKEKFNHSGPKFNAKFIDYSPTLFAKHEGGKGEVLSMQPGSRSLLATTLVQLQALQAQLDQLDQLEHPLRVWEDIVSSIKTEKPVRRQSLSSRYVQDHKRIHTDLAFAEYGLGSLAAQVQAAILDTYDFSRAGTLCDIGGGDGTFLAFLLQAYESLRGMLVERPQMLEHARWRLAVEGVTKRCRAIAGNFFEEIPAGADLYTLKWVLRDYEDEQAVRILENCRQAMLPHAKLLIIEAIMSPSDTSSFPKLQDLGRLVSFERRKRTEAEFRSLLRKSGLRVRRIIPACAEASIIEVVRG